MKIVVKEESTLLKYLEENLDMSKRNIKKYLKNGSIYVDGTRTTQFDYPLMVDSIVVIDTNKKKLNKIPFAVLYEDENIIVRSQKYKDSQYQYYAKSDKPFVSKGAYGYAHGGFTPQECIIPAYEFANENQEFLGVSIVNKSALQNVTGTYFIVKLKAESVENTLFKAERKVVIQIYGNGTLLSTSSVYRMTPSSVQEAEFALVATGNVKVVVVDIQTQQQVDFCEVKKSASRDLDDLF